MDWVLAVYMLILLLLSTWSIKNPFDFDADPWYSRKSSLCNKDLIYRY